MTADVMAYVFWHRPRGGVDTVEYADALREFHTILAAARIPGFLRSWSVRVADLPWLGEGPVYEDRYVVEDFTSLGRLNVAAVAAGQKSAHDAAATRAAFGTAGLYALIAGDPDPAATHAWWFDKPAGTSPDQLGQTRGSLWQRQMTLGPGPEFQLIGAAPAIPAQYDTPLDPV